MNIITVESDDKEYYLLSIIKKINYEGANIVVFFKDNSPTKINLFYLITSKLDINNLEVKLRDLTIKYKNNFIRFVSYNSQAVLGMQYDTAICYDEIDKESLLRVHSKVRWNCNIEKNLYILKDLIITNIYIIGSNEVC